MTRRGLLLSSLAILPVMGQQKDNEVTYNVFSQPAPQDHYISYVTPTGVPIFSVGWKFKEELLSIKADGREVTFTPKEIMDELSK